MVERRGGKLERRDERLFFLFFFSNPKENVEKKCQHIPADDARAILGVALVSTVDSSSVMMRHHEASRRIE